MKKPFELLSAIAQRPVRNEFGAVFAKAFSKKFTNRTTEEELVAAGIICSLFLSSILEGFPTIKLHTFVRNIRDEYSLFTFDCKSYDPLYESIEKNEILLLDKNCEYQTRNIAKNDILEAFDFFTNR